MATEQIALFPQCKGAPCDKGLLCIDAGGCLYKSSADEAREVLTKTAALKDTYAPNGVNPVVAAWQEGEKLAKEISDFDGAITGKGFKGSMQDDRKVPLTLIPPVFIRLVGQVLQFGAKKYARGQWMKGMSFSEVLDAAKRHIEAIENGEDIDPESGKPHIGHVGCCLAFLAWFMYGPRAEEYKQFDDRLFRVTT